MKVRPIREDDLIEMHGELFKESMRGIAVEDGDDLVAIAGVIHGSVFQCFSSMTEQLRRSPKNIVRAGRALQDLLNQYTVPVYALTDPEQPAHARFLEWMGFEYIETTTQGRLYKRWTR